MVLMFYYSVFIAYSANNIVYKNMYTKKYTKKVIENTTW